MAEQSFLWTTGGSGDGAAEYSRTDWSKISKVLSGMSAFEGIAPNLMNQMLATVIGANTVRVQTGGAVVDGKPYYNDGNVDVNIPSAVGTGNTRIDRIVLRADWSTQMVRVHRIAGTDAGTPTAPVITQTSGTTYDITLYQATVDTAGVVTLYDERINGNPLVSMRQGGDPTRWDVAGVTNYAVTGMFMQVGSAVAAEGTNNLTITFPEPFGYKPIVFLEAPGILTSECTINDLTETTFDLYTTVSSGFGDVEVYWLAIGPRP